MITQDLINDIDQLIAGAAQDAVRPEESSSALAGISRGLRAKKEKELEVQLIDGCIFCMVHFFREQDTSEEKASRHAWKKELLKAVLFLCNCHRTNRIQAPEDQ